MADAELDIELRSPAEVAGRCIVLAALIRRLSIESLANSQIDDGLAADAFDLRIWLQSERRWEGLTAFEASVLERQLGGLTDDEMATMAWQAEGLASLGWALGLSELAPLGELAHVEAILTLLPSPWDATGKWASEASLRLEPDIARERDRAELFDWRLSAEAPRRAATDAERTEYDEAIADVASEAQTAGLADLAGGDLTIGSVPVSSLDADVLERFAALAEERLRAMNWLCGFGDTWDRVPLDV